MANITQNGIHFNVQNNLLTGESLAGVNGKIYSLINPYNDLEDGDNISTLINAVEIDWNGAELGNTYDGISRINTTGDLIKVIQG